MIGPWSGQPRKRTKLLTIRVTPAERERAELVAKHHGSNVARVVRAYFREEAHRIEEEKRAESLQIARKSEESREPRPPPGFRPPKAARKAGEARPPRAEKRRRKTNR